MGWDGANCPLRENMSYEANGLRSCSVSLDLYWLCIAFIYTLISLQTPPERYDTTRVRNIFVLLSNK